MAGTPSSSAATKSPCGSYGKATPGTLGSFAFNGQWTAGKGWGRRYSFGRQLIGFGAPNKQGTKDCHGSPLGADEIAAARKKLMWTAEPFTVPDNILSAWRKTGARGKGEHKAWLGRHDANQNRTEFDRVTSGELTPPTLTALIQLKQKIAAEKPKHATRQSSGAALEVLLPAMPCLIGGSADLTPSNNTQVKNFGPSPRRPITAAASTSACASTRWRRR